MQVQYVLSRVSNAGADRGLGKNFISLT